MIDLGSALFGAGGFLSGAAALVTALRTSRKISATAEKVDHVAHQVTTSNGTTLAAIVEHSEDRRLLAAPYGDLSAADAAHVTDLREATESTTPTG